MSDSSGRQLRRGTNFSNARVPYSVPSVINLILGVGVFFETWMSTLSTCMLSDGRFGHVRFKNVVNFEIGGHLVQGHDVVGLEVCDLL